MKSLGLASSHSRGKIQKQAHEHVLLRVLLLRKLNQHLPLVPHASFRREIWHVELQDITLRARMFTCLCQSLHCVVINVTHVLSAVLLIALISMPMSVMDKHASRCMVCMPSFTCSGQHRSTIECQWQGCFIDSKSALHGINMNDRVIDGQKHTLQDF